MLSKRYESPDKLLLLRLLLPLNLTLLALFLHPSVRIYLSMCGARSQLCVNREWDEQFTQKCAKKMQQIRESCGIQIFFDVVVEFVIEFFFMRVRSTFMPALIGPIKSVACTLHNGMESTAVGCGADKDQKMSNKSNNLFGPSPVTHCDRRRFQWFPHQIWFRNQFSSNAYDAICCTLFVCQTIISPFVRNQFGTYARINRTQSRGGTSSFGYTFISLCALILYVKSFLRPMHCVCDACAHA